jgi:hypothetical protein
MSQISDFPAAMFIVPMPVEKGQAGGGVEFLTRMMPVPLVKMPETQVVPQDVKTAPDHIMAAMRNVSRILLGRHRMGHSQLRYAPCADRNSACKSMLVRGPVQEGIFSRGPFPQR